MSSPEVTGHYTKPIIEEGDVVVLWTSDNRSRTIRVLANVIHQTHLGELPLKQLIGQQTGCRFDLKKGWGLALPPALEDRIRVIRRNTNILYPKDIGIILMKLVIGPGSRVIELGTGSAAMTSALAYAVSPGGTVHTFDICEDYLKPAEKNFRRSGVISNVEFSIREPATPLGLEPVHSIVMDIPEPWTEIEVVTDALVKGGRLVSLNPTYNQIEKMSKTMADHGYVLIECMETIFRHIVTVEGRVRPSKIPVPHTEFMLFGVKSGEEIPENTDQYYSQR
jgi:tRNA (adenine57-N1/adenine58-N1)-methyltransferase